VTRRIQSTLDGQAYCDDHVAVFASLCEPIDITIIIRQTGRSLRVSQTEWAEWQRNHDAIAPQCHEHERKFLSDALPHVWQLFPDKDSFVLNTNWTNTERHLYADM
jgi:hypothetical protein